jgi:hypothetical protein
VACIRIQGWRPFDVFVIDLAAGLEPMEEYHQVTASEPPELPKNNPSFLKGTAWLRI